MMPEVPITDSDVLAAKVDSLVRWVNDLTEENHNLRRQRDAINEALNVALRDLSESSQQIFKNADLARRAIAEMGCA